MATFAQQFGYRPATRAEKAAAGFKPSSRAYISKDDGGVISHRALQTMGLQRQYSGITDRRGALEARAQYRREQGYANPRGTFDHMVRNFATTPVKKGGLGAKYNAKTHTYQLPNGEKIGARDIARSSEFRDREGGMWQMWERIRHQKGPQGERRRRAFLKRYGFLERLSNGKWRYIPM